MSRPLKIIFYSFLFLVSFLFFIYWLFPMDAVRSKVIGMAEGFLGPSYQIDIESLDTYWLTGVDLKGVDISRTEGGKKISLCKAEEITARAGLFSLLFGSPKFSFDLRLTDSRAWGSAYQSGENWVVDGFLKNINLGEVPLVSQATGLRMNSVLSGDIQLEYNPKDPVKMKGTIDLTIEKLSSKAGTLLLAEMEMPLPDANWAGQDSSVKILIDKGAMSIDALHFKGDDFLLDLKGKAFLAQTVEKYRLNLQGKFRFSPKIWVVLEQLIPEPKLKDFQTQKQEGETYPLSIDGPIMGPQVYSGTVKIFPFQ